MPPSARIWLTIPPATASLLARMYPQIKPATNTGTTINTLYGQANKGMTDRK